MADELERLAAELQNAERKLEAVRVYAREREAYGRRGRTVDSARIASDLLGILSGSDPRPAKLIDELTRRFVNAKATEDEVGIARALLAGETTYERENADGSITRFELRLPIVPPAQETTLGTLLSTISDARSLLDSGGRHSTIRPYPAIRRLMNAAESFLSDIHAGGYGA